MIQSFKEVVACEPFVSRKIETTEIGTGARKFTAMTSKVLLTPLKVVYGSESNSIYPGDFVYVLHEAHASPWSREYEVEGADKKIVLVPLDQVKLVDRQERP